MCICFFIAGINITTGAIVFVLVCLFLQIIIPACIFCCIKFGICGSNRKRRLATQVVTTAVPPPTATFVSTTTTTMRELTGIYETNVNCCYVLCLHAVAPASRERSALPQVVEEVLPLLSSALIPSKHIRLLDCIGHGEGIVLKVP